MNWERSLAFWIHLQTILERSPIETFHIIRSSTIAAVNDPRGGTATPPALATGWNTPVPNLISPAVTPTTNNALPLPHALLSPDVLAGIATSALNGERLGHRGMPSHRRNMRPVAMPGFFAFSAGISNSQLRHQQQYGSAIDDAFVRRFVALHKSTLRKFWVIGMRCSEEVIHELYTHCEKLERIRADDVDEFPVRSKTRSKMHMKFVLNKFRRCLRDPSILNRMTEPQTNLCGHGGGHVGHNKIPHD